MEPLERGDHRLAQILDRQRGYLFPWVPVLLALGIGGYFAAPAEPGLGLLICLGLAFLGLIGVAMCCAASLRPVPIGLALVICGFLLAFGRTHWVEHPVLGFRYYGPVEGRIVAIDRSASDKLRLTLDQVSLSDVPPHRTPDRVRISLHGVQMFQEEPGLRIMMTAHLSPPQGPVEPGGFDFRRAAWFKGIGAVGYTRTPALVSAPAETGGLAMRIFRLRIQISQAVQEALPGRTGAFAAAVTTGDRSGMGQETLEALRGTNLAHLLAISGLHMGLLTGFVFTALRVLLATVPAIALRWPVKKIAAGVAIAAGAFYYAMSGGNVATERAFIMVSVLFLAVLIDRRAITLRAVAIAAVLVLVMRPESLVSPGFQMSFAATTALVAVFGSLTGVGPQRLPKWLRPVFSLVLSSAVAGLATSPVAAAHFNRIADYGLLANVLSVPMMGLVVVPGAVLAALLAPFGLAWLGLAVMKPGIDWILAVADWVHGFEGAVTPVVAPGAAVLPVLALGALWIMLWQGRARWGGLVAICAGFLLWAQAERPEVLIADTGRLIGVLTPEGRVLSKAKGDGFAALSWLENDGDAATQAGAFGRAGLLSDKRDVAVQLPGMRVQLLGGRGARERVAAACAQADIVVVGLRLERPAPCAVFDGKRLLQTGALALYREGGGWRIESVADNSGARIWAPGLRR